MASGDVFAIKLHLSYSGQACRPGFYLVEGDGGPGVDPVLDAAQAVIDALGGAPLAGFSEQLFLAGVEAQDVQPATSRSRVIDIAPAIGGNVTEDNPLPPQDSMLIEWTTTLKGGKGKFARRARTYMPGCPSVKQVGGFLGTGMFDDLSAFASKIFDPFVSDGTAYALAAVAFVPLSNPRVIQELNLISAFALDNIIGIQRSRRPGRGI